MGSSNCGISLQCLLLVVVLLFCLQAWEHVFFEVLIVWFLQGQQGGTNAPLSNYA